MRSMMAIVAVAAVILLIIKFTLLSAGPRYRYVEVFHRKADGTIWAVEMMIFNLDARASDFHGLPDGETRYRETINRLKLRKEEYKVTSPRDFRPDGRPIC